MSEVTNEVITEAVETTTDMVETATDLVKPSNPSLFGGGNVVTNLVSAGAVVGACWTLGTAAVSLSKAAVLGGKKIYKFGKKKWEDHKDRKELKEAEEKALKELAQEVDPEVEEN